MMTSDDRIPHMNTILMKRSRWQKPAMPGIILGGLWQIF
jgi:hypothetical protein